MDWQWQCCGGEFSVGDEVELWLYELDHPESMMRPVPFRAFCEELGVEITHVETHHGPGNPDAPPTRTVGRVESISAVFARPAEGPAEQVALERSALERWESDLADGRAFDGWIVGLTNTGVMGLDEEPKRSPGRIAATG